MGWGVGDGHGGAMAEDDGGVERQVDVDEIGRLANDLNGLHEDGDGAAVVHQLGLVLGRGDDIAHQQAADGDGPRKDATDTHREQADNERVGGQTNG